MPIPFASRLAGVATLLLLVAAPVAGCDTEEPSSPTEATPSGTPPQGTDTKPQSVTPTATQGITPSEATASMALSPTPTGEAATQPPTTATQPPDTSTQPALTHDPSPTMSPVVTDTPARVTPTQPPGTPTQPPGTPTQPSATAVPSDAESERSLGGCSDGIDNDDDGFIDCDDFSCFQEAQDASPEAQAYCFGFQERTLDACSDGDDNDDDGYTDCRDWSCTRESHGATDEALAYCNGTPTPPPTPTPTAVPTPTPTPTPTRAPTPTQSDYIDPASCTSGDRACPPSCLGTADSDCATWRCGQSYPAEGSEFDDFSSLSNSALTSALHNRIDDHNSVGYDTARELMYGVSGNIDVRLDGQIECVYTGYTTSPNGSRSPGEINTEHSWPRSDGAAASPMNSDIHHLFPTREEANSARSSYPFGETRCDDPGYGSCSFSEGGSQLGTSTLGGFTVFEVRPDFRGDIARAHFYFSVRYGMDIGATEEQVLRQWHCDDPPDARERRRNDQIEMYQYNRNPFVDRPDYVEQIADF